MLHFNDGISIDTGGKLRILKLQDGYYVVGEGMLLPWILMKNAKILLKSALNRSSKFK